MKPMNRRWPLCYKHKHLAVILGESNAVNEARLIWQYAMLSSVNVAGRALRKASGTHMLMIANFSSACRFELFFILSTASSLSPVRR